MRWQCIHSWRITQDCVLEKKHLLIGDDEYTHVSLRTTSRCRLHTGVSIAPLHPSMIMQYVQCKPCDKLDLIKEKNALYANESNLLTNRMSICIYLFRTSNKIIFTRGSIWSVRCRITRKSWRNVSSVQLHVCMSFRHSITQWCTARL